METQVKKMAIQAINNTIPNTQSSSLNKNEQHNTQMRVQLGTAVTSALGVATAVAAIAKRQGFSLNPSAIKRTPVKDWAIFKITDKTRPDEKVMKFRWQEIMSMGIGSVTGGLTGGAIFDKKENFKSKCQEAVNQILGDITIPLSFVALPTMLYKKFEDLASKPVDNSSMQKASKYIKGNKFLKILCPTLVSGTSLAVGIIAGNKVSNKLNEHFSGHKTQRKIRATDFAPHLDDVCLAITLMAEKSLFGDIVSKFVPVALTVAGIETGRANPQNRED